MSQYFTGGSALKNYATDVEKDNPQPITRGIASTITDRTFVGYDTNVSVKSEYNRGDYDWFRKGESLTRSREECIADCMKAYKRVGIVHNVIDLMSDFACQGIRLQHPIENINNFYQRWWQKVSGKERSERILSMLYRAGNVIVKRTHGKVTTKQQKKWRRLTSDESIDIEEPKVYKKDIPLKYTVLNPLTVGVLGKELALFTGKPVFVFKVSSYMRSLLSRSATLPHNSKTSAILDGIPPDLYTAMTNGAKEIMLDQDKLDVYYYRKDDWELWAEPMIAPIIDDLNMYHKIKLADLSALDGAISNVRLWNLGIYNPSDPISSILPTKAALNKLRNILANNVGGGTIDLAWGPELKFTESNSQVWRFLGSDKYKQTLDSIYDGLGIPNALRSGGSSTNTASFLSLNTLVKRLQYGRDILVDFWTKQLNFIHEAMGFSGRPPVIIFDFMALADEAAEKQLLINLWDRDIIPTETILELFGRNPYIEDARLRREKRNRGKNMPDKASPFHNPDKEHEYKKLLLQGGDVTASELGVELAPRKDGEKSVLDKKNDSMLNLKQMASTSKTGLPGRPGNVIETKKRKPKPKNKLSTKASFSNLNLWSVATFNSVADKLNKPLLSALNKSNARKLSKQEFEEIEKIKFAVFSQIEPFSEISDELVYNILSSDLKINENIYNSFYQLKQEFISFYNREPNTDESRHLFVNAYTMEKYYVED